MMGFNMTKMRGKNIRQATAGLCALMGLSLLPPPAARAEIIVRLEATAEKVAVHLEPDLRSPIVETLARGTVVKLASGQKFRTNWYYVQFASAKSGRTLAGYVLDTTVRKLNS